MSGPLPARGRRCAAQTLWLLLPACAAGDSHASPIAPVTSAPGRTDHAVEQPVEPGGERHAAGTAADAADASLSLEARLRNELATGGDPAAAALDLAGLLCGEERPTEALPVLAAAIARADEPALRVARAGVYRDLGQRHRAVEELRGLRSQAGAAGMHPGLVFELAELEALEGDRAAALQTVAELKREHGTHPWMRSHGIDVEALADELATQTAPRRLRLRDLLGNLRGCPDPLERVRALDTLVDLGGRPAAKALTIGLLADEPLVRARAVQRFDPEPQGTHGAGLLDVCSAALADPDAGVRAAAAGRLAGGGREAVPLLLDAIGREPDQVAFTACHGALRTILAEGPELPVAAAFDEATRRSIAASWSSRWQR